MICRHRVNLPFPGRLRRVVRRLNGVAAMSMAVCVVAASCGEVHFAPSPFSPQKVQLIYSKQEKVTIIRWRMGAQDAGDRTRFELLDADGNYQPIDFATSVFPGGVKPCTEEVPAVGDAAATTLTGSCAQLVVRGQYRVAADAHPVRSIHDTYGQVPGSQAAAIEVPTTLSLTAYFGPKDEFVYLKLDDKLASDGPFSFPRQYDRSIWPSTGLCLSDIVPSDASFAALDPVEGFAAPSPLTELGSYCVAARPRPNDDGGRTVAQSRALTVPLFVNGTTTYRPPVEKTPIIYRIVLDLLLAPPQPGEPDSCLAAMQYLETTVDSYMNKVNAPKVKEPTIDLSGGTCTQDNDRRLDATAMGASLQDILLSRPEKEQAPLLFYFDNVKYWLPPSLTDSLVELKETLAFTTEKNVELLGWLFGTEMAHSGSGDFSWNFYSAWLSAFDHQAVETDLGKVVRDQLPYTTEVHDPAKPLALLSDGDVSKYDGARIKICASSPKVDPATMNGLSFAGYASWPIQTTDPPGYTVYLDPEIKVPAPTFVNHTVTLRYQICTRYCSDHPYVDEAKLGQTSWAIDPTCAGEGT